MQTYLHQGGWYVSIHNHISSLLLTLYIIGVFYATGSRSSTEVMEDRFQALEVAYSDVKKAFEYYLSHLNQGRPFIMAAHSQVAQRYTYTSLPYLTYLPYLLICLTSMPPYLPTLLTFSPSPSLPSLQGTKLMARLLADCVDNNPPVLQRLICAYLIGGGIPMSVFQHDLPSMHASMSPEDVGGCVVGWDTIPRGRQIDRIALPVYIHTHFFLSSHPLLMYTQIFVMELVPVCPIYLAPWQSNITLLSLDDGNQQPMIGRYTSTHLSTYLPDFLIYPTYLPYLQISSYQSSHLGHSQWLYHYQQEEEG